MSEERIRVEELDVLQTDIDDESPQVLGNRWSGCWNWVRWTRA